MMIDDYTPASEKVQACPYPYYGALRDGPSAYRIPGTDMYVVSRYEDAARIARQPDVFSNQKRWQSDDDPDLAAILAEQRYPIRPALVDNDPPSHSVYRKIASRAFTPGRLRDVEPAVRQTCNELVDAFASDGEVEFVSAFCEPLPMRVACDLLGLPREMGEQIGMWASAYIGLAARLISKEQALIFQRHVVDFNNYIADVLETRRANPGDDAISELTQAKTPDGRYLDLVELSAILRNLLAAAGETTAYMLGNTMLLLLEHPEVTATIRAEPSRIPRLIEESLRCETPLQWNWRQVLHDAQVGDVPIPAGSWLHVVYASANRDGAVFEDPDRFDVDRPNLNKQLGFGLGIHFCLGAPLARMEGRIAFETILARLRNIRLADRPDAVRRRINPTARSLSELHLRFEAA
jgi:cytochrome P450